MTTYLCILELLSLRTIFSRKAGSCFILSQMRSVFHNAFETVSPESYTIIPLSGPPSFSGIQKKKLTHILLIFSNFLKLFPSFLPLVPDSGFQKGICILIGNLD